MTPEQLSIATGATPADAALATLRLRVDGLDKEAVTSPTSLKPKSDGSGSQATQFSGIVYAHSLTKILNKCIVSPVSALFRLGGPATIFRAIWAVIINSVNGVQIRWAHPHICKKVTEIIPPFADCYSPASIVFVGWVGGAIAAVAKTHPSSHFRANHAATGISVLGFGCDHGIKPQASTATLPSASQLLGCGKSHLPAVATATPLNKLASVFGLLNNRKFAKFLAGEINKFSHAPFYVRCTHLGAY